MVAKSPSPQNSMPVPGGRQQDLANSHHLCPDLVVPEGSECTLLVPRLPQQNNGSCSTNAKFGQAHITIDDLRGAPVFRAACNSKNNFQTGVSAKQDKRLLLCSVTGQAIFGFCRETELNGNLVLTIHHHTESLFGTLRPSDREGGSGNKYTIISNKNWRVHFQGHHEVGHFSAIDDNGQLLAIAEPVPERKQQRFVRIGPFVDAGLMVLAMIGMDWLEQQQEAFASSRFEDQQMSQQQKQLLRPSPPTPTLPTISLG